MADRKVSRIKRLAKEGSWIVIGQIATVAGGLVLVRMLTEYLEPAEYGELALGLTLAGLVNQVLMGGVTAGIGRFYSIAAEKGDLLAYLKASRWLMGCATLTVGVIALALTVSLVWTDQVQWLGLGAAVLFFSVLSGFNSSLSGIQNAARQRSIVALHGGVDAWLKIALAIGAMVWLGTSSTAVVIGYACSSLLVIGSQFIFLRRLIKPASKTSGDAHQWIHQMWAYSWPMAAGGLFNWGYYASQRWALELFATSGEVGHFYALTQIAYTPVSMAGAMFMSFLTPILFARAGAASDHDRLRNAHRVVIRVALVGLGLTLAVAVITHFIHDFIFRLMVAPEYRHISMYMPYVVLAAGILVVSQTLAVLVAIENQTRRFLPLAIIGNILIAATNFYFTHQWGIGGLIASMVVGSIIHLTWMVLIIFKNVNRLQRSGSIWV